MHSQWKSRISGFYKLPLEQRVKILASKSGVFDEGNSLDLLQALSVDKIDCMVENGIGVHCLPLGVALNFIVNNKSVIVPMAIEESSVIAACSYAALLASHGGGFTASCDRSYMFAQIQLTKIDDLQTAIDSINAHKKQIIADANQYCQGMLKRGGGVVDLHTKILPPLTNGPHASYDSAEDMLIVYLTIDVCDAMGANIINTVAESIAPLIGDIAKAHPAVKILSNLCDKRIAKSSCKIPYHALSKDKSAKQGRKIASNMVDIYRLAARDPYRAATHNKGIMNGIDAFLISVGNDWRAIESAAHAYAARDNHYTSLTYYSLDDENEQLHCHIEMPIPAAPIGGCTKIHGGVQNCLKLIGDFANSSKDLSLLAASVGLSQNIAALRALADEGIQKGHMSLHARQVAINLGAKTSEEIDYIAESMNKVKKYDSSYGKDLLTNYRNNYNK